MPLDSLSERAARAPRAFPPLAALTPLAANRAALIYVLVQNVLVGVLVVLGALILVSTGPVVEQLADGQIGRAHV